MSTRGNAQEQRQRYLMKTPVEVGGVARSERGLNIDVDDRKGEIGDSRTLCPRLLILAVQSGPGDGSRSASEYELFNASFEFWTGTRTRGNAQAQRPDDEWRCG